MLQLLLQQLPLSLKSCVLGEKHVPVTHSVPALSGHGVWGFTEPSRVDAAGVLQVQEVHGFPLENGREFTKRDNTL